MLRPLVVLALTLIGLFGSQIWAVFSDAKSAGPSTEMQNADVIQTVFEGQQIEVLQNSETMSQAIDINASGSIIGSREVANASKTILRSVSFFCKSDQSIDMPVPTDFTNVEACAISDNDCVVGYASRAIGHPEGSLRAVVWRPLKATLEVLPSPDGDSATQAQGISADGTRISGYSTGKERLRPVVWQWQEQNLAWQVTVLTTHFEYNPYLMSSTLQISPDGQIAAGCCTEAILPDNSIDSALFVWRYRNGLWHPQQISTEQLYLRGLNNQGQIVGSNLGKSGRQPCLVSAAGQLQELTLLPGDRSGEARDINSHGTIIGWSDGPTGPDGGPKACSWNADGGVAVLRFNEQPYSMVYAINDSGQLAGMITLPDEHNGQNVDTSSEVPSLAFRTLLNETQIKELKK